MTTSTATTPTVPAGSPEAIAAELRYLRQRVADQDAELTRLREQVAGMTASHRGK